MAHDHVDDFIDDPTTDVYASWVLNYFRLPAILKVKFKAMMGEHRLYCSVAGNARADRFRVTGASRIGDVFVVQDFEQETGYDHRVSVNDCMGWSRTP